MTASERPFTLVVPAADIDLLRQKLALTRFPDELDDAGWDYGAPLADLKRLTDHWQNKFDMARWQNEINALPQFTRDIAIDGFGTLNIHYLHQKSDVQDAVPLLFVHGWPGHFLEAKKILPLLTAASPDHPSFHVVAISLPGYGWSEAPKKPGFKALQYAELGNKLMLALGYNEYVTQGGDWGYFVTRTMAFQYGGKNVKAWHTNFPLGTPPELTKNPIEYLRSLVTPLSAAEKAGLERTKWFTEIGRGYAIEQSTQPQTLGYALADSPVGLLAWIYDRLRNWTDSYPWTDDEVVDWVSVYWFSRAGPAATLRIYYECKAEFMPGPSVPPVPMGISSFPKELQIVPKSWARRHGKIVFEADHDAGGHFAAFEQPEALADDVRKMFGKGGPAYGVVSGKNGYASDANGAGK